MLVRSDDITYIMEGAKLKRAREQSVRGVAQIGQEPSDRQVIRATSAHFICTLAPHPRSAQSQSHTLHTCGTVLLPVASLT